MLNKLYTDSLPTIFQLKHFHTEIQADIQYYTIIISFNLSVRRTNIPVPFEENHTEKMKLIYHD